MKYDPDFDKLSTSYNLLQLLVLIYKTVLTQTNRYPFATVYEQESYIYSFSQSSLSNEQCYEEFDIKIDIGSDIGVTGQHQVILSHVAD